MGVRAAPTMTTGSGGVMIGVSSESPEWFGAIGLTLSLQGGRDAAGWVWKAGRCR